MTIQPRSINSDAANNRMHDHSQLLLAEKVRVESDLQKHYESLHSSRVALEDQPPILHDQFVSIRHHNLAHEKLKAINAALERLKRGEYGICEECNESISEKRLRAVPWTRYCLNCQESPGSDNRSSAFRQLRAA